MDARPDELGLLTCSSCGARLRTRQPVKVTVQPSGAGGQAPLKLDARRAAAIDVDQVLARLDLPSRDATIRLQALPGLGTSGAAPKADASLEALLSELRAIRATQQAILDLLQGRPAPGPGASGPRMDAPRRVATEAGHAAGRVPPREVEEAPAAPATDKVVLLVDDDAQAQLETAAALRPLASVTTASDANGGLASIALEKPDAIVLELGIGGSMPGPDFVNLVKATIEWTDIPLLLHTRLDLVEEGEARGEHGADFVVRKRPGSAQAVAERLGALFTGA